MRAYRHPPQCVPSPHHPPYLTPYPSPPTHPPTQGEFEKKHAFKCGTFGHSGLAERHLATGKGASGPHFPSFLFP